MPSKINIAIEPIAHHVHLHMNTHFYAVQLCALQNAASELGLEFVHGREVFFPSPSDEQILARAIQAARIRVYYPLTPETWDEHVNGSMEDGYAVERCQEMLAALRTAGINLQPRGHSPLPEKSGDLLDVAHSVSLDAVEKGGRSARRLTKISVLLIAAVTLTASALAIKCFAQIDRLPTVDCTEIRMENGSVWYPCPAKHK